MEKGKGEREGGRGAICHEDNCYVCISVLTVGFEEEAYLGSEDPDQRMPCSVRVRLQNATIEAPLTFRLIPQTVSENFNTRGPAPTATLRGANASSKDLGQHLYHAYTSSEYQAAAYYAVCYTTVLYCRVGISAGVNVTNSALSESFTDKIAGTKFLDWLR